MKKKTVEVYETYMYDKFNKLEGNRDAKCVNKIIKSIKSVGYIMNPIIVNEKMEVIDGQNRLQALKALNLPVQYYIVKDIGIEEARALNLGRTNWKPIDYCKSYAQEGNVSYQRLLSLMEASGFSIQEVYGIAKNNVISSGWNAKTLEEGNLTISQEEYDNAIAVMERMKELEGAIRGIVGSRRCFVTALAWCMRVPNCDVNRFIRVISLKYSLIRPIVDVEILLRDITGIYNNSLKDKKKKIDFDVIYRNL